MFLISSGDWADTAVLKIAQKRAPCLILDWYIQWSGIHQHGSPNRCQHTGDVFKVSLYGRNHCWLSKCQCQVLCHWITAFIASKQPDSALFHCQQCPLALSWTRWPLKPGGQAPILLTLGWIHHGVTSPFILLESLRADVGGREPWVWLNDQWGLCGLLQSFKSLCGPCSE